MVNVGDMGQAEDGHTPSYCACASPGGAKPHHTALDVAYVGRKNPINSISALTSIVMMRTYRVHTTPMQAWLWPCSRRSDAESRRRRDQERAVVSAKVTSATKKYTDFYAVSLESDEVGRLGH